MKITKDAKSLRNAKDEYNLFVWLLLYVVLAYVCADFDLIYNFFLPVLFFITVLTFFVTKVFLEKIKIKELGLRGRGEHFKNIREFFSYCRSLREFRGLVVIVISLILLEAIALSSLFYGLRTSTSDNKGIVLVPMLILLVFIILLNSLIFFRGEEMIVKKLKIDSFARSNIFSSLIYIALFVFAILVASLLIISLVMNF